MGAANETIALYDRRLGEALVDEYYGGSGFLNFGYWDETTGDAAAASARLVERLLEMAPRIGPDVLDLACGGGASTQLLARRHPEASVTAANLSAAQLELCRERSPGARLACMDGARLGFRDDAFDTMLCVEAAFHFRTRADFLAEAFRILRPGGALLLSDALISGRLRQDRPHWDERNLVSDLAAYADLFAAAGFDVIRVVDATEQCWRAAYRRFVRFVHEKFRAGHIDVAQLDELLQRIYRLAEDLEHYVLVAAVKPSAPALGSRSPRIERVPRPAPLPRFDPGREFPDYQKGYETVMYWPALEEYFAHSDFVNYGYWASGARDAGAAGAALVERLLDFVPERKGHVLDVACGKGATTRQLARHWPPRAVVGVNLGARQLESSRSNAPGASFVRTDAVELGFRDGSFDVVVCVEAAFHFQTRERFLREALRVLRPGGSLVLSDILLTRDAEVRRAGRHADNYCAGPSEYAAKARAVGFAEVRVVDATRACFDSAFWHLVHFAHERLLLGAMTAEELRTFRRHFFEFVPETRHYLLAGMRKPEDV